MGTVAPAGGGRCVRPDALATPHDAGREPNGRTCWVEAELDPDGTRVGGSCLPGRGPVNALADAEKARAWHLAAVSTTSTTRTTRHT